MIMTPHVSPIQNQGKFEIHRAGWIIVNACTIIENGYIEVENGKIKGVYKGLPKQKYIDHGPGVLMPPLVNAHLHLELSALKNKLPFSKGFKPWVQSLLKKRDQLTRNSLIKAGKNAAKKLMHQGNLYISDISSLGLGQAILHGIRVNGLCFNEHLGSDIKPFVIQKKEPLSICIAGHAPHTTSPQLLKALKNQSTMAGLPFSIHLAESDDESIFIRDKKGDWADFLTQRGIDWSSWNIGLKTPVAYINDLQLLDSLTIVVHLLNVTTKDMETIGQSKTRVCVCPRSNWNLHGKLPDIEKMMQKGILPALGTDSLASCDSLNIFDEMAFIGNNYPGLDPETIFSMGTINGAKVLGFEKETGTIAKGKKAHFIYRSTSGTSKKNLLERIITNE